MLRIDATDLKTHPTASSLNKGGMTSKLHGVCHSKGGPLRLPTCRGGNAVASLVLNVLRKDLPPAAAVMGDKRV